MTATIQDNPHKGGRPELIFRIDGFSCNINDAIFLPGRDSIVTGSEDRTMRVWMRRDTGRFWPSVIEVLPSPINCLSYAPETQRIYAGLENGTVVEYLISQDLNHVEHIRDYLSHTAKINGVICASNTNWVMSVSKDRTFAWYSTANGRRLGCHQLEGSGTCIEYDFDLHYVFVGDSSGRITLLLLTEANGQGECRLIRELRGHDQTVTCLSWNSANSHLFSGSTDRSVILWDIGGAKGAAMELQGHTKEVTSTYWWGQGPTLNPKYGEQFKGVVISGSTDGQLIFWFMDPSRLETPSWTESDICQICATPFFWNIRKMWNTMAVGVRQHHCRRCGQAVCDKCSPYRSTLPKLGFERDVRICSQCFPSISDSDRRSLAIHFDAHHAITRVRLEDSHKLLLTVGEDRVIKDRIQYRHITDGLTWYQGMKTCTRDLGKVWDMRPLLAESQPH